MGTGESSMSGNPKPSDFNDLIGWAHDLMDERKPDFVIGDHYLHRWWVVPRNEKSNVYLHEILHSDDDRAMHDHPWDNTTTWCAARRRKRIVSLYQTAAER
jgi:hypothetical protein